MRGSPRLHCTPPTSILVSVWGSRWCRRQAPDTYAYNPEFADAGPTVRTVRQAFRPRRTVRKVSEIRRERSTRLRLPCRSIRSSFLRSGISCIHLYLASPVNTATLRRSRGFSTFSLLSRRRKHHAPCLEQADGRYQVGAVPLGAGVPRLAKDLMATPSQSKAPVLTCPFKGTTVEMEAALPSRHVPRTLPERVW